MKNKSLKFWFSFVFTKLLHSNEYSFQSIDRHFEWTIMMDDQYPIQDQCLLYLVYWVVVFRYSFLRHTFSNEKKKQNWISKWNDFQFGGHNDCQCMTGIIIIDINSQFKKHEKNVHTGQLRISPIELAILINCPKFNMILWPLTLSSATLLWPLLLLFLLLPTTLTTPLWFDVDVNVDEEEEVVVAAVHNAEVDI